MRHTHVKNGLRLSLSALGLCIATAGFAGEPVVDEVAASPAPSFIPADFEPPTLVDAQGFKLVPLGPDVVKQDYAAYMSSIEHLQQTFTRSTGWPRADLTLADSMVDMETEAARFANRESFAYGVLTPDGQHELGSVYVRPSPVSDYDAVVSLWGTKAQYDAGFDAVLYRWVRSWVARDWPFAKVAYPGREIAWGEWDVMTEAAGS
ncbi:twin-arginine translocation pathway signal protein [Aurantiacibacter suaedae]|uniref:twin-arginine translocation pathway signal protein n=1 Tax=Aurantiacibacter suaedae TaxID=2545755 RepID=UPI0010F51C83|nr:twin-arginine translocation pathway signal protein [Aurantiacibacter suaedae]